MKPLSYAGFEALLHSLKPLPRKIAVAVSGGADSLALTLLLKQWCDQYQVDLTALTVDHKLREESTKEAYQVQEWLHQRGIAHTILSWDEPKPQTGIQQKAREARYQLFEKWCLEKGVVYLFLAHHAHDQLETFMMRLSKGSGLQGLLCMSFLTKTKFGFIVRPFLETEPERLKETLNVLKQPYIYDSSNDNLSYSRIKWRQALPYLNTLGLTSLSIYQTTKRLRDGFSFINHYLIQAMEEWVTVSEYGYLSFPKEAFFDLDPFLGQELLNRFLMCIGGRVYPIRYEQRLNLYHSFRENLLEVYTLGGCLIIYKKNVFYIFREERSISDCLILKNSKRISWDGRFDCIFLEPFEGTLRPLSKKGIQILKDYGIKMNHLPYHALLTLPSFWKNEELIYVPHSKGYYSFRNLCNVVFFPRYSLKI